ncbi:DUF4829 domain-containing protein [Clostridium sardiniense]|uniref:DUF4829 domain-containing protein n=1 Tax=Clostridium sardiniense TaxID=29369 RepID=A0ABS7L2A4_CLOSR|nr:DUF4829 domain-containing protein [Clostridium sardiniense]MBY0757194.1 DUF4829 domain-containing protein [Clostridium sardiniense]MDQ0461630.1 hypothetical protein [Clostridium sardiniense]
MNKKLKITVIAFVFVFSMLFIFIRIGNSPESVIKDYIKYMDTQNINKLNSCRTYNYRISNEGLETIKNIESMKLLDIEVINDESIYNTYMHNGNGSLYHDLSINDIKIYQVKYDIKYKDDNKAVTDSGEYIKKYFLIKEHGSRKWKIDDIGQ